MKKINLIVISSFAAMSLVACGQTEEPIPDYNNSFWEDNGVNGGSDTTDNQTSYWDSYETSDSGTSYWDSYESSGNGESFWDQNATSGTESSSEIILPQEYTVCLVGHKWARSIDNGPCEDYILEFDVDGYWKAFEYYNNNWNEVDYGYVDFDYDYSEYILFSQKYDIKFDVCTYENTVLNGALCNYHQDAQTPATAAEDYGTEPDYTNEDYNLYFSNFNGEWRVIDPTSDTESDSYYDISNGMWEYYYYDGNDWVFGLSGYLELEDGRTDSVIFYTDEGSYLFGAWEFDTGILKCSDEVGTTLERY